MKILKIFALILVLALGIGGAYFYGRQSAFPTKQELAYRENADILRDYINKFQARGGAYILLNADTNEVLDKKFAGTNENTAFWAYNPQRLFHLVAGLKNGTFTQEDITFYNKKVQDFQRISAEDKQTVFEKLGVNAEMNTLEEYLRGFIGVMRNTDGYLSEEQLNAIKSVIADGVKSGPSRKANVEGANIIGLVSTTDKTADGDKVYTMFVGTFTTNGKNYAIAVMLDEPQGQQETYGNETAGWNVAPLVAEIIKNTVNQ